MIRLVRPSQLALLGGCTRDSFRDRGCMGAAGGTHRHSRGAIDDPFGSAGHDAAAMSAISSLFKGDVKFTNFEGVVAEQGSPMTPRRNAGDTAAGSSPPDDRCLAGSGLQHGFASRATTRGILKFPAYENTLRKRAH